MIKKEQIPLFIVIVTALIIFTFIFASRRNYEFIFYIGVIVFFLLLIIFTNKRVDYPLPVLWGLGVWALLHMSGGGIYINGRKLYSLILVPLVGEPYDIFRYDQFVHIIGFGVATLLMYYLLKPVIRPANNKWAALAIVVVMAGLGVGALNEIIEFIATVIVPNTGVGGYVNTALDLVSDLIGAIAAVFYLKYKEFNQ